MNDDEFNDADLYGDDDYGMDDDTFDDTDMTKALAQADLLTKNIQECITPRSAGVTKSNVVAHTTSPSSCSPRTPRSRRASSSSITGAETIVTYRKGRAIEAMGLDIAHTKLGKTFSDQVTSASRKKGTNTFSRSRIETLSRPKSQQRLDRTFSNDDDERNCTFQPETTRGSKASEEYDYGNQSNFLHRTTALEAAKQRKLATIRGEKEYECRQNKKMCPNCLVPQSYAEWREKKKKCSNCGGRFRIPNTWDECQDEFLERMEVQDQRRLARLDEIKKQVEHHERHAGRVPKSKKKRYYDRLLSKKASNL